MATRDERAAQRRQLMAAIQALVAAWQTMPMREAMATVYGDGWETAQLTITTKAGRDIHVWYRVPREQAAG